MDSQVDPVALDSQENLLQWQLLQYRLLAVQTHQGKVVVPQAASTPGCSTNPTRFNTDVFVTYTGTGAIADAEIIALQNGFRDSYNSLQAEAGLCDSFSRRIDFVSINQNDGHFGPVPPNGSGPFITYRFLVTDSCCGCAPDSKLFFHGDGGGGKGEKRGAVEAKGLVNLFSSKAVRLAHRRRRK
jgi:hypothetical protein